MINKLSFLRLRRAVRGGGLHARLLSRRLFNLRRLRNCFFIEALDDHMFWHDVLEAQNFLCHFSLGDDLAALLLESFFEVLPLRHHVVLHNLEAALQLGLLGNAKGARMHDALRQFGVAAVSSTLQQQRPFAHAA